MVSVVLEGRSRECPVICGRLSEFVIPPSVVAEDQTGSQCKDSDQGNGGESAMVGRATKEKQETMHSFQQSHQMEKQSLPA